MNKKVKALLIITSFIIAAIVWFGESRKFYCLNNGECITVWKTYGGTCYVVPGKYFGLIKPSDNYVQTTNVDDLDVIWKDKDTILIYGDKRVIINKSVNKIKIEDYNSQKLRNDSLYLYFDGNYHRYKKDVKYVSLFIKEGYAKIQNAP